MDDDLVEAITKRLRERHYRCEDLGGAVDDRRLRFAAPSRRRVEVRLLADPRPPTTTPHNVRFGELSVAVDDRRTVFAGVFERLDQDGDPESLFEIDQCLRVGAELDTAVAEFAGRKPRC